MIYETKGLTLEQVDELYSEVSSARKSTKWAPTMNFRQRASMSAQGKGDGHNGVVGDDKMHRDESPTNMEPKSTRVEQV